MQKKWWHGKVAYQIYPKSFKDTTGSGIGDLNGITEKLDYLKSLGVDIIWISPCYVSPLADEGYDIADYYKIDPRFGTNGDMWRLIAEAKRRDMYILMDLVVNHCSDEHEWFKKALADPYGKYAGYFFFEKAVDGHAPNNWRSYFGGSAWEKVPGTDLYYLHLFHKKQPDLNWENRELREEIYKMMNWWLDRGIAGFRLDAIMNIKKALPFEKYNYTPDRDDGMCRASRMIQDAKGLGDILAEMRDRTFKPHNAFSVGEIFNNTNEQIPEFIGDNGYFSSMFDFRETILGASDKGWYDFEPVTPDEYRDACFTTQRVVDDQGMVSTIIENHDEPRGVSRYIPEGDLTDRSKKFLAVMQFMQKGLPFIYQGQEIGMENIVFHSIDEVDDISTIDEYKVAKEAGLSDEAALKLVNAYSRDNARTPMQWDDSENAGFTTGTPWLRVNPNYRREGAKSPVSADDPEIKPVNVAAENRDPDSVLNWYRKLTNLRKNSDYSDTVVYGEFVPFMEDQSNFMAFYRKGKKQTLLVLGNYRNEKREVKLPGEVRHVLLNNCGDFAVKDGVLTMDGYQAVVLEMG